MKNITRIGLLVLALPAAASANQQIAEKDHGSTWTGTLTSVNARDDVVSGRWWLFTKTFQVGHDCAIQGVDNKAAELSDLRPGEQVRVHYQDVEGVLVADRIVEKALHYDGTVESVDPKAGLLSVAEGPSHRLFRTRQTFRIAPDCKVTGSDGKREALADLARGDEVAVIYEFPGASPMAYRIREQRATFVGTIDGIDLPDRTVKARDGLNEKKFNIGDACRITVHGRGTGRLRDLTLGQKCRFTYEDVNGINVVVDIAPMTEQASAQGAARS